jgi:hypothetical protein
MVGAIGLSHNGDLSDLRRHYERSEVIRLLNCRVRRESWP